MQLVPKAEFSIVTRASKAWIPELIAAAGPEVTETYIDFFTATIRNRNTRQAYARACWHVVKKGKTPVWSREDAKTLLDSIPKDSVSGLRDRALIAAMLYSFACVSAVLKLKCDDYYHNGAGDLESTKKAARSTRCPCITCLNRYLTSTLSPQAFRAGNLCSGALIQLGRR